MHSETKEMGAGLLFTLREELDRWLGMVRGGNGTWVPATDMYADEGELFVEIELPGVEKADIEVLREGHELTVRAATTDPRAPREAELLERRRGTYERTLHLPSQWDVSRTHASFENGILTLRAPLAPEPEGLQRIDVDAPASHSALGSSVPIGRDDRPRANGSSAAPSPPSFILPAVIGGSIDGDGE
jgi:HSP20 family molecular chaperone IbpA